MKIIKTIPAAVLLAGVLCSCSMKAETTPAPTPEEDIYVQETSEPMVVPDAVIEDFNMNIVPEYTLGHWPKYCCTGVGSLMGFDNCYAVGEEWEHCTNWTIYNEDGDTIAYQSSLPDIKFPDIYSEDLDGDGIDEVISPWYYSGDGGRDVFIYRNNNGVIERGIYNRPDSMDALNSDIYYDEGNDKIVLEYSDNGMTHLKPVYIDGYEFDELVPGRFLDCDTE